ncbi:FUN14 domain-containing protein [Halostella sp. PRR32]|uniref:FUN14 domain-containing protein n=1 Tax=Halostella sp. PRR32 TaxID=3098147 RepID=UPI00110DE314|nr:FUN14 domain-containing protein [Halostella sp. PRR32]
MIELDPQQLGLEFGSGAFIGAVIGFAAKKIAKILAVIVGVQLALFKFLEAKGILFVDWNRLSAGLLKTGDTVENTNDWIQPIISTLSLGVGFTGGFLVGFKKG